MGSNATEAFSAGWRDEFARGAAGCIGAARDPYVWRDAGYGSNINCGCLSAACRTIRLPNRTGGRLRNSVPVLLKKRMVRSRADTTGLCCYWAASKYMPATTQQ